MKIYDTKTHRKVDFVPIVDGQVGMYVCGPTVYNRIHIGNARTFISFDCIRRYLMWRGFSVTFVQNITDVDDKIIARALEEGRSASDVANEYTEAFIDDMHALGVLDPDVRPKATEEIPAMIELIAKLIEGGHAYEVCGDVYFSVRSYEDYGQLSGRNIDEMESGHRELRADGQGIEDRKRDPLDFALWKAAKPGEPFWESPWGRGRPGWHIECSAMSRKYLGVPFDIHGGGSDLIFPHHENERAQSEAAFATTFANVWMHSGMLQIVNAKTGEEEKMSKSAGNFFLLADVLNEVSANALRMLMVQTHYRNPLVFGRARLTEAQSALDRLQNFCRSVDWLCKSAGADVGADGVEAATPNSTLDTEALLRSVSAMRTEFIEAMDDDFNTAGALGAIFGFVSEANALLSGICVCDDNIPALREAKACLLELMGIFGIALDNDENENAASRVPEGVFSLAREQAGYEGTNGEEALQALLAARQAARVQKEWERADGIRDGLTSLGYTIEDTAQGSRVLLA